MERRPWFCGFAGLGVRLVLIGLVLAGAIAKARAYDETPHRAARLSYLEGSVTIERVDNAGSYTAQLNMPLAEGQRISTSETGQAEIEFEDGSLVRLTPFSSLSLDALTVDSNGSFLTQMTVVGGLVYAELRATPKYAYRLVASGDAVSPVENATVRVNMDQPPAVISVFSGAVRVESGDAQTGYRREVRAGESLREDASSPGGYFLTQLIPEDSWDSWNEDRDRQASQQAINRTSARDDYAGQEGYGWSDLDANGTWYDVAGSGPVWQPSAALDSTFDPYGYGSWVWYPAVGYVWASGYSWGWVPYRCGRWSYWSGFGWGWRPGTGCRTCGWGFAGGVFAINIAHPPFGYHFLPLPGHNLTGLHPIVVARPGRSTQVPVQQSEGGGVRTIAGRTATPLLPAAGLYVSHGESSAGAALRRDFPINTANRQPITGVETTYHGAATGLMPGRSVYRNVAPSTYNPGMVVARPNPGNMVARPSSPAQPIYRPSPVGSYPVRPSLPPPVSVTSPPMSATPPPHISSPPPSQGSAPSRSFPTR